MQNEELLVRYVTGDMEPGERAQLEERLRKEGELRQRLSELLEARDEAKAWFAAPAPGVERVRDLQAPGLHVHSIAQAGTPRRMRQLAVAAAIFLVGFLAGNYRSMMGTVANESATQLPKVAKPAGTPRATPQQVALPDPAPPEPSGLNDEAEQPAPIYTHEENGRVVVQTVLRSAGTRATWVVDGQFQLAQSAAAQQQ